MKRSVGGFVLFLVGVGLYGALVAFANGLLRRYGHDSELTYSLLVGSVIYVYYKAWRWLCRWLDRE